MHGQLQIGAPGALHQAEEAPLQGLVLGKAVGNVDAHAQRPQHAMRGRHAADGRGQKARAQFRIEFGIAKKQLGLPAEPDIHGQQERHAAGGNGKRPVLIMVDQPVHPQRVAGQGDAQIAAQAHGRITFRVHVHGVLDGQVYGQLVFVEERHAGQQAGAHARRRQALPGEARLRPCTAYSWTWPCAVNTGWNLNSTESS